MAPHARVNDPPGNLFVRIDAKQNFRLAIWSNPTALLSRCPFMLRHSGWASSLYTAHSRGMCLFSLTSGRNNLTTCRIARAHEPATFLSRWQTFRLNGFGIKKIRTSRKCAGTVWILRRAIACAYYF